MKRLLTSVNLFLLFFSGAFAQTFYNTGEIQEIRIFFAQQNWDYLLDSIANANEDARLLAPLVIVNGIEFDSVGVKYKGNSSYNPNRPKNPFSINLDEVIGSQDYEGHDLLKLSNAFKDPTFVREVLGYEIARNYMAAPRANYAKVYVNGAYHGLYSNVESIKTKFLNEYFYSNDNALFKCDPTQGATSPPGCPMGGGATFTYIGPDSSCYKRFYEIESDYGWNDLVSAANILNNNTINAHQAFDIDRILWMLAFDNVLVNLDSYIGSGHNYYAYKDGNGRFCPIIWDINEAFGSFGNAGGMGGQLNLTQMQQLDPLLHLTNPGKPFISKLLANPLYLKSYIAHMRTILAEQFTNGAYLTRAMELQALVNNAVSTDPNGLYTYNDFINNLNSSITTGMLIPGITTLMNPRITYLNNHPELQKVPPVIANVATAPAAPVFGSTAWVTASVSNATGVRLRYRFGHAAIFQDVPMFDDGTHQDGAAGDGIFGASMTIQGSLADYYVFAENANAARFSPERAEYEFYTLEAAETANIPVGAVVINEFLADNESGATDPNGQFEDWVELYNTTAAPVLLSGAFLSDKADNLAKWPFPSTATIPANGYLIVWLDEDQNQPGLHANFKLSKDGEAIYFSNTDGSIIDQIEFGAQTTDITTGRCPNGTGPFGAMNMATPNAGNSCSTATGEADDALFQLKAFPNPGLSGQAFVAEITAQKAQQARISIFNALGVRLYEQTVLLNQGMQQFSIPGNNLPAGIYWLQAETEQQNKSVLLVVR
ncbi:MAG: CotH kinase family protein [Saprospiraceae bacterium]|nr:CotH kinase family protein [Saprospiraceae bacterium]